MTAIAAHARQGDVLITRIDTLPPSAKPAKRDEHGRIVLAHGESSGHAHTIRDKDVMSFRMESAERDAGLSAEVDYVLVGGQGATLNHELVSGQMAEHEPIILAPGLYQIGAQREYAPEAIRRAVD